MSCLHSSMLTLSVPEVIYTLLRSTKSRDFTSRFTGSSSADVRTALSGVLVNLVQNQSTCRQLLMKKATVELPESVHHVVFRSLPLDKQYCWDQGHPLVLTLLEMLRGTAFRTDHMELFVMYAQVCALLSRRVRFCHGDVGDAALVELRRVQASVCGGSKLLYFILSTLYATATSECVERAVCMCRGSHNNI